MSTVQEAPTAPPSPTEPIHPDPRPYRISTEAFLRMLDAEVFGEDRVELWDGQVIAKMAKSIPHAASGIRVLRTLARLVPPGWCLSSENPVGLTRKSIPLPDFAMVRESEDDYSSRHVLATDVGLIVELSASSLKDDSTFKLVEYARAGIPAYWVVYLVDNVILVFEQPNTADGRYAVSQTVAVGQSVPLRLDGVLVAEIPAVDLLPVRA